MANRHRGEIEAELGGQNYTLVLTLGALAEIESAYGGEDMIAIAERFEGGRIKASDAIKVIGAKHDGEVTFDLALASAGLLTFTAI